MSFAHVYYQFRTSLFGVAMLLGANEIHARIITKRSKMQCDTDTHFYITQLTVRHFSSHQKVNFQHFQ